MMFGKILFYIFKYVSYIIVLLILTAFLAKTGNMPGVVPKTYIDKINEYTDITLIKLNLIHDNRILKKYKSKYSSNEKDLTNNTKLNINIFNWLYNAVFINNYTLKIYNEINSTAD